MPALPQARKSPRQARSQQMVEVILEATARVLAERGYAGTNTNLVAERAGVSVGSIYQYFPNKDSLVTALHERHAAQMGQAIERVLAGSRPPGLRGRIEAIVQALLTAHQLEPALHKVLEKEFPFFDAPKAESAADNAIYRSVWTLLDAHRAQLRPGNLDLATWTVLQVMESLVHAAVIDPPARFSTEDIAATITEVLMGYLGQAETCSPA
ncbi:TetR/AcrR family transcriptional regulator [Chitinimonas arctica]|uniref:TetR/AcrR family transcriptional regulator n=1 Tax=Chitinimonas arctica TaxID=2594795 RepID=A0A516SBN2_9NEIS|nr:TetR/AcrR family transcriptional regulator [Chitinimonas arctica]QDQ25561.1 TetR/AcrR family transcriptional regulator [Chitinimonas arctica]